jgi:hypothetical protein
MKGAELEAADGSMRRRSRGCRPVLRRSSRRFTDCCCTVPSSYTCRIPYSGAMLRHKSHPHQPTSQLVRVYNWVGAGGCHVLPSRMLWEELAGGRLVAGRSCAVAERLDAGSCVSFGAGRPAVDPVRL